MIQVEEAIKIVERESPRLGTERIGLADAVGRVLAEDIIADMDMPPFDRSQMDGYAVKAADTMGSPATLKIVGESAAGRGWHRKLGSGEAVRIMTGAAVPKGADAVQKLELANESDGQVTINEPTDVGRFIVGKGKEIRKGKTVLRAGEIISERNIAVLAAFGYARVKVGKRPRVSIISTGTEIVEIGRKPKRDQIRNSNSIMLEWLCRRAGAVVTLFPIVGDDISDLTTQLSTAVRNSDLLITTGGVSVGKYDLTKLALEQLGAEIFFDKAALKPGKPTVFGKLKKTLVFGLPGNPVSAAVTFYLFVRKALLSLRGAAKTELDRGHAVASERIKGTKERDCFLPALLSTLENGSACVTPVKWHGSSDFVGFARANSLVVVPKSVSIEKGELAEIVFLPDS